MTSQCDRNGCEPRPPGSLNRRTCVRCSLPISDETQPFFPLGVDLILEQEDPLIQASVETLIMDTTPRDVPLEERLTRLAARASGFYDAEGDGDDRGLSAFSSARALPGGVRKGMDKRQEALEEIADCRNYAVWGIQDVHEQYLKGDPDAVDEYVRHMRALQGITLAWHAYLD